MADIDLIPVVDDGLGNSAYLVDLGDGRALAVDASLDLREIERVGAQRGLTVAFAADTHLHADFISGAHRLAATDGARVLASAAGNREFSHVGLHDGDEVDLGGLRMQAVSTPGHTHEHLSFVLLDGDVPKGVFTGGSLLVGSAARTDLVSPDQTDMLARRQYASLQRLAQLPDDVAVWPTHGAGSFCSAPPGEERTSTIGREKATNDLLRAPDEDAFVEALLGSLGSFPPYFLRLAEVNRRNPDVVRVPPLLSPLDVPAMRRMLADGAVVVDARPVAEFAGAHVPGALSIPLRPAFVSWLGWLLSGDERLIVVRGPDQDPDEIAWQAAKIGYQFAGELDGGMDAWMAAGHPVARIKVTDAETADHGGPILDVRQDSEYFAGHIPGVQHIELGDLPARASELPREPTTVMCGHGERAMSAASLLERAGHRDLTVVAGGGADEWARATGRSLETGS